MKTKLLLIYGYVIPVLTSVIVSVMPMIFGFIRYNEISTFISKNSGLLIGFLAVMGTITIPFQTTLLSENNPHVLTVLEETNVRSVFIRASMLQAVIILSLTLCIFILSAISGPSDLYGYFELLALAMITFESIALISNGIAYGNIREKIIIATTKAKKKNMQKL